MSSTVTHDQVQAATSFISAFNERDWERMRSLFSAECVYEEITKPPRRATGADAVVTAFQTWARTAPEIRGRVANVVAGDDQVALEVALEGAMKAPYGNFSPAGKRPIAQGSFFIAFEDRLIRELRVYYDSLAVFQILGVRA
jgi:steroid delta-isomerase-like uncharacterized protein